MAYCVEPALRVSPNSTLLIEGPRSSGVLVKTFTPLHTSEAEGVKRVFGMIVWGCSPH